MIYEFNKNTDFFLNDMEKELRALDEYRELQYVIKHLYLFQEISQVQGFMDLVESLTVKKDEWCKTNCGDSQDFFEMQAGIIEELKSIYKDNPLPNDQRPDLQRSFVNCAQYYHVQIPKMKDYIKKTFRALNEKDGLFSILFQLHSIQEDVYKMKSDLQNKHAVIYLQNLFITGEDNQELLYYNTHRQWLQTSLELLSDSFVKFVKFFEDMIFPKSTAKDVFGLQVYQSQCSILKWQEVKQAPYPKMEGGNLKWVLHHNDSFIKLHGNWDKKGVYTFKPYEMDASGQKVKIKMLRFDTGSARKKKRRFGRFLEYDSVSSDEENYETADYDLDDETLKEIIRTPKEYWDKLPRAVVDKIFKMVHHRLFYSRGDGGDVLSIVDVVQNWKMGVQKRRTRVEKNFDKLDWQWLSENPCIFD
jgi:hypothetical protein